MACYIVRFEGDNDVKGIHDHYEAALLAMAVRFLYVGISGVTLLGFL